MKKRKKKKVKRMREGEEFIAGAGRQNRASGSETVVANEM
jgi:hypothetical protein